MNPGGGSAVGLFVTGTDTGVGKTVVACGLARAFLARGVQVVPWKPAETGWPDEAGSDSDAARLRAASGRTEPIERVCPYRLARPVAPSVAAAYEGRRIDPTRLEALYAARAQLGDLVLVEGAGGLLVPLDGRTTYLDLAASLKLPVLIVAANRLGVVNHCALTIRVAVGQGLSIVGFVLNHPSREATSKDASISTNGRTITDLTGIPCLGEIPYTSETDGQAEEHLHLHEYMEIDALLAAIQAA